MSLREKEFAGQGRIDTVTLFGGGTNKDQIIGANTKGTSGTLLSESNRAQGTTYLLGLLHNMNLRGCSKKPKAPVTRSII